MTYEEQPSISDRGGSSIGTEGSNIPKGIDQNFFKTVKNEEYFLQKNLSKDDT